MGMNMIGMSFFSSVWRGTIDFFIGRDYLNIKKMLYAASIILLCFLFKRILIKYVFKLIRAIFNKMFPKSSIDLFTAFEKPLSVIIISTGFYAAIWLFIHSIFLTKVYRSILIIGIFKGFYNLSDEIIMVPQNMKQKFGFEVDNILFPFISKCVKVVIAAFAITIFLSEWNIDVQMLITGLGIGGLALSLAAKDAASNVIAGVILIIDKPFSIGDWVEVEGTEGTVEELSFRSTKIRTFTQELVVVPNSTVANSAIANYTKRGKRKSNFIVGINYETSREKIELCVERIEKMVKGHDNVLEEDVIISLDSLNKSSIDLNITYFTDILSLKPFLKLKEEIYLNIMDILKEENVNIPYPTTTININK
ncbi:MscS family membrane protein [Hathewaya proteolytica DSM 3090]|uniref:MscS family membrane protein n=1 Tax=Hathewaya proteolytica DSM 3090 TaxID=1121331 RepID=A0A1M6MH99_9CLOT|nr:mechanosensitive ion channel family protein [Hathewaya proteolytica]SHJ82881.1 MscS family membrane protein [Hathewaya proteolytica DSM 3090]